MGALRTAAVAAPVLAGVLGLAGPASADARSFTATPASVVDDASPVEDLQVALTVTDAYWQRHFSEHFGGTYAPPLVLIGADEVPGYYDVDTDVVVCSGVEIPVEAARANALYCLGEDWLGVESDLVAQSADVGDSLVYLAAAHEWGHAVQARLSPEMVWQGYELQADCLAGAALGGAAADGTLVWEDGDSEELAAALTAAADQFPWADVADHGSPAERIEAFQLGFDAGPQGCLPVG